MPRLIALALLAYACLIGLRAEETIDSRALYVLDCIDHAKYLETEGYSRVAFTTLEYCRSQWLQLHHWAPDWEPAKFNANLAEIDLHLAKIKMDLKNQPPPPEIDQTFFEFLDILLTSSKSLEASERRLQELEKFQKNHPDWEPDLISTMLLGTKKDIAASSSS